MQTYLEYYRQEIQPRIRRIDLFLKTEEPPYEIDAVAEVLELSLEEITRWMQEEQLIFLTKRGFLHLLQSGSSSLCRLFCRAVSCGSPQSYTPQEVAYIFGLPLPTVQQAMEQIGKVCCTEEEFPSLFRQIRIVEKRSLF